MSSIFKGFLSTSYIDCYIGPAIGDGKNFIMKNQ